MGMFDKLFGRVQIEKQTESPIIKQAKRDIDAILIEQTEDGKNVFEFYDAHRNFRKYSNTTRVIINRERVVKDRKLFDCMVAWWKQDNPEDEEEITQKRQSASYEHVIAGIDPEKMITDVEYLRFVMRNLLEENKVKRYIEIAMIPEEAFKRQEYCHLKPCGRYVGEVITENNMITKIFSNDMGRILHSSLEMENERRRVIEYRQGRIQAMLKRQREEIEAKRAEIEEYEKQEIG